ncbi:uncharacterized protein (DUF2235 family) [Actinoplanes octamycinicus]|uniref:Uncharacterized protein (DUF2235 family) n=1 Tax=Actinoplanes octamycinicus TaxID=135948 RepID=A0A7W7H124_9ACTN|nr:DUF2235 domain-containing protein [Actinoplanes octamycinicus]MBB4741802.1 uncharacterized protein (DUF2235 family) [Actinoplanes octamycinicus]GIE57360.1 hypothetical protein Aoc01nite_27620 [Actinoplanes octamycinicus]
MGKNIVICLDGTGNEVKAVGATNVLKTVELLDVSRPAEQVVYYDPGVGTFASPSAWTATARALSRLGGLALGHGLRRNVGEAYGYLMRAWQPGDRVFVFGFSRGAYTARALCGMLYRIGLLRPGNENLIRYAIRAYARRPGRNSRLDGTEGWDLMDRFSAAMAVRPVNPESRAFPIHYLGVYDTVKATRIIGRDIHWPYTNQLLNVRVVRHAVAIDERRRPYREKLIPSPADGRRRVTETWFAGVHSDVGGGFDDHPELGRVSLRWMLEGARAEGLLLAPSYSEQCRWQEADAFGDIHRMGWKWALIPRRTRPLPPDARVHASVRTRIKRHPEYAAKLPADVRWDDSAWP